MRSLLNGMKNITIGAFRKARTSKSDDGARNIEMKAGKPLMQFVD